MVYYFNLPSNSGYESVLARIEEIEKISSLVSGLERSNQIERVSSSIINKQRFGPVIEQVAKEHNINPKLINAVIEQESGFNPNAISKAGALGLMQLMPGTARDMGVKNLLNPHENIRAGTKYLSSLLNRYHGNVTLALSAYNAGPNNIDRFKGVPPFEETKNYVQGVLKKLT